MAQAILIAMDKLHQALADILEVGEVRSDQELQAFWGGDSLAALPLLVSLRDNFGAVITTSDLRQTKTVGDSERLVLSKQQTTP
jgi:acyl carrier protein